MRDSKKTGTKQQFVGKVEIPSLVNVRVQPSAEDNSQRSAEVAHQQESIKAAKLSNRIAIWGIISSLLGSGLIVWSLFYTRKATEAAVSQAKTAAQEFNSSQRPWLEFHINSWSPIWISKNGAFELKVTGVIKNVGHSIAKNVYFYPIAIPDSKRNLHECEVPKDPVQRKAYEQDAGYVIFPDETGTVTMPAFSVVSLDTPGGFLVVSCVRYRSTVDDEFHLTKVEYWIDRVGPPTSDPKSNYLTQQIRLNLDPNGIHAN